MTNCRCHIQHLLLVLALAGLALHIGALTAAAQEPQPTAPPIAGQGDSPKPAPKGGSGLAAPAVPSAEKEDPDAVSIFKGLREVDTSISNDLKSALDQLQDRDNFGNGVGTIISKLNDQQIKGAKPAWNHGSKGAQLIIHYLNIDDSKYESVEKNVTITTNKWYVWHEGVGFDEFTGTTLHGESGLYVLSISGPFKSGKALTDYKHMEYEALVKKKLPLNVQHLLALLSIPGYAALSAQAEIANTYAYGFGLLGKLPSACNITIGGYLRDPNDRTQLHPVGDKVIFDSEGDHIWDVSIGIPIKRVEELQYDQTNNIIQSRQVDKSSILALGNLYLRPIDLRKIGKQFSPALAFGVGLQGKFRDRVFAGVTTNLPPIKSVPFTQSGWFQLFRPWVGVMFLNTSRPAVNPAPGSPTLVEKTVRKLGYGLNIPVMSVIQKLTSKSSSSTDSTASTGGTKAKTGAAGTPPADGGKTGGKTGGSL